jgi:hypothetical protein
VSVIGDAPGASGASRGIKRLPTVYLGNSPVFADRNLDSIRERVERSVEAMVAAPRKRPYLLQPCRLEERMGLYWRDIYNRSAYRSKLVRLGVTFSEDPYPRFTEEGAFKCEDWGAFIPDFAILAVDSTDPDGVEVIGGGLLVFGAATGRFGHASAEELGQLARMLRGVVAVSSDSPASVVDHLRRRWEQMQ